MPAVPLVKHSTATSSGSTSTTGTAGWPLADQLVDLAGRRRQHLGDAHRLPLALQLGGRALRVERHDDGAEPEHGEVGLDQLDAVGPDDRHPVAPPDAPRRQGAAEQPEPARGARRR